MKTPQTIARLASPTASLFDSENANRRNEMVWIYLMRIGGIRIVRGASHYRKLSVGVAVQ
jgi:hypothetical protein